MRAALRRRLRLAALTDALAVLDGGIWSTRCLHCRRTLQLRDDGEPLGHTTLEHVVPQAWFGRRAAAALTARVGDDADDPRNLALACARCNHDKGTTPGDPAMHARARWSARCWTPACCVGDHRPPRCDGRAPAAVRARRDAVAASRVARRGAARFSVTQYATLKRAWG